jgi:uncharacterized protein YcgI (DUF1989 family)
MPEKREVLIPATEGRTFIVRRGESIKVIDVEGHQIGDFICFNLHTSGSRPVLLSPNPCRSLILRSLLRPPA